MTRKNTDHEVEQDIEGVDYPIPQDHWVAMLEQLYYAAYRLHDLLDDVDPGYEYAVQQLCTELQLQEPSITDDMESRAINAAQYRSSEMVAHGEERPLSEYGVTPDGD